MLQNMARFPNYQDVFRLAGRLMKKNCELNRETGGPSVTNQIHKDLAADYFRARLDNSIGTVETNFSCTGLVCQMSLALSPELLVGPFVGG